MRDEGSTKSVKSNWLVVHLPNENLFKMNAEEGQTLDESIRIDLSRYGSFDKVINVILYVKNSVCEKFK